MKPKLIVFVLLAALMITVIFQNTEVVTLRVLFWQLSMSRIILLLLAVVTGFVMGFIATKVRRGAKRRR